MFNFIKRIKQMKRFMKEEKCRERMNHFKETVKHDTFSEFLWEHNLNHPDWFLGDPPLEPQKALDILFDYLIDYPSGGYGYITTMPESTEQVNSLVVHEILMRYSKTYRKERKDYASGLMKACGMLKEEEK